MKTELVGETVNLDANINIPQPKDRVGTDSAAVLDNTPLINTMRKTQKQQNKLLSTVCLCLNERLGQGR